MKEHDVFIATFIDALNYGAVLQAYALGTYIQSLGYKIRYVENTNNHIVLPSNRILKRLFYLLVAKKRISKKKEALSNFKEKYIDVVSDAPSDAILICGSDQVWNIEITGGCDNLYFGDGFTKAIAYAVSCGELDTLKRQESQFVSKLDHFISISARESDLANYVSSFNRICKVVCDPTMLLKASDYDKICNTKKKRKPYLLIYQMSKSNYLYEVAVYIAKVKHLEIIEINNNLYNYRFHTHKTYYSCSPEDFLGLFRDSSFVITNSFHGTSFSLIYNKPFISIKNGKRDARVIELCERLGVKDRLIVPGTKVVDINLIPINFDYVNKVIAEFSKFSKKVLADSLAKGEV